MPETTGGKQAKGQFRKGQSGNPDGRPNGARHKITLAAETLLEGEAEALTRKAVEMAKDGDTTALRLCLERIYPVRRGRPVVLDLPATDTAAAVSTAMSVVLQQMAAGDLTSEEASTIVGVIEAKRKAIETDELDRRLREVEGKLEKRP